MSEEDLVTCSADGSVKTWMVQNGTCIATEKIHEDEVMGVACFGRQIFSASIDKTVRTIKPDDPESKVLKFEGHEGSLNCVAISSDGERLATGSEDATAKIWDVETRECLFTLEAKKGAIIQVAFSPDNKLLATASYLKKAHIWNVETGECLMTLAGHISAVRSVAFSPDGSRLATGSGDMKTKIWSVEAGECLATIGDGDKWLVGVVFSVAFSPDGKRLATGGGMGIMIYDSETFECSLQLAHEGVVSVVFSSDGSRLASASNDETAKVWNLETGECITTCQGHEKNLWDVAFRQGA
eukprot:TRINITY_DN37997_c0_g1_i1.p1 TRINITY_DN37997_c0_g1~~TRINITY_DN37997_c0_g1_i1.p1  ORF type:complete len:298 (-),score=48.17 TRINITY_DN37997_c0_g1_i1:370-1263(-)